MTLDLLEKGRTARIDVVGGDGALRQHFLDMGVIPGSHIRLSKYAPMGDPMQFELFGYELTLRKADAAKITITPLTDEEEEELHHKDQLDELSKSEHPGLGEGGRYHDPTHEHPLPADKVLTFALAGNQNSGKTTLFNQMTGSNQHVGNFPGVTVDRKSGSIRGQRLTEVTDLPGIYSLSPYSQEEIISRSFILEEHPDGIINIVDATNIERNLYLTMQLMELGRPMVLALNMMDEMEGNGGHIRINDMERLLGIPVVPIAAISNSGVEELVEHAMHVAKYQEGPARHDFCSPSDHNGAVHRCLHAIRHLIEDHAQRANIPVRFAASKIAEGDNTVVQALQLSQNELETMEHILRQMEEERGMDRAAAMADMRYTFINQLCKETVVHPEHSKQHERSAAIDKVLTGKHTAIPVFLLIMAVIFWLTFETIGGTLQGWMEELIGDAEGGFIGWANEMMTGAQVDETVRALLVDGVFAGVGAVLTFLPIIVVLFLFLSLLEDTGYMARIAFVMDPLLHRLGLSGRSIVPLLMGFGCSVTSVMASRTLPSERDRRLTVMLLPFMTCTAKLPIFAFFCAAFFPDHAAQVMIFMYLLGIVLGILSAVVLKNTTFKGEAVPFVMELPNYRLPSMRSTLLLVKDKSMDFITRAFTIIFLATIVIWFLQSFSFGLQMVEEQSESILGVVGGYVAPLFAPIGLGDWRIIAALVSGFLAKESVVGTLEVLYPAGSDITQMLTTAACWSLMVFSLVYTPCAAAIATIRRELGGRDALRIVIFQCLLAYVCAGIAYCIALAF